MKSLWQAASGRPGQGTERRRRRAAADQTRDKSQLRSKQSGSGVGALAGRAGPGWPALEETGRCLLSLASPAGAVCGAVSTGSGSLEGYELGGEERTEIAEYQTTWACIFSTTPVARCCPRPVSRQPLPLGLSRFLHCSSRFGSRGPLAPLAH